MMALLTKRLLLAALVVWGVLTTTFALIQLAPGDPTTVYLRPEIDPEAVRHIRRQMGLDRPLGEQYLAWTRAVIKGDWGISLAHHRPVGLILREAIPNTLQLTLAAFFLQLIVGVGLGVLAALNKHTALDHVTSGLLLFWYSMPGFWVALMALLLFSYKLGWLPSSQMASLTPIQGLYGVVWDRIRHLILPAGVLAIPFACYTARFVRGTLIEILSEDYIRTCWAYGLKRRRILVRYALRSALLPLSTLISFYLPFLLGGAVITEYIFSWPGMGRITVNAIFAHDYPLILATTLVAAGMVVVGNLLSDLLYAFIDPRIRYGAGPHLN